ncbi:MAG: aminoglycoside phosphotransferase family protein [Candidatus Pacebacteria bacterium]|nr:aminoglycoside phosphotransferase family protein [Candidatus Paceibacterota bacterium]
MLQEYYPDVSWKHVSHIQTRSFNFLYEASDIAGRRFFVKFYRDINISRLRGEWRLYGSLMKSRLSVPRACANRNSALGSIVLEPLMAFSVHEYVRGKRYRSGNRLPGHYATQAARALALLHNTSPSDRSKLSKPTPIAKEVADGMRTYRKFFNEFDATSFAPDHARQIQNALAARIKAVGEADVVTFLKHIERLPLTVVHGDYAPSNIIFGNDQTYIVDWERARLYYWQYDLFRAVSNFASSGKFTPYDSEKDMTLIKRFLAAYFSHRNKVSRQEILLLKMMPRIYCFIDTFPFKSVFTRNERWAERYIPHVKTALSWWLTNERDYIRAIDTYCNH